MTKIDGMETIDLAKMAAEAGLTDPNLGPWMTDYGHSEDAIKAFAALLEDHYREYFREVYALDF